MEHNFVLNALSLPAANKRIAYELMLDAVKGMIAVGSDGDRCAIYSDNLWDIEIAPDYRYRDFLSSLGEAQELDLQTALMEFEDKAPMLEFILPDTFQELASSAFYFPDEPYSGSIDILGIAWHLDAILLSLATSEKWADSEIKIAKYVEGDQNTGNAYLQNVSCEEHGRRLRQQYELEARVPIEDLLPGCAFSQEFIGWHDALPGDLHDRVVSKLTLAAKKEFQGGEPLFKTLHDADGIRELRFSAVQGGAVRILFHALPGNRQAILIGFIKKSSREGYEDAIASAKVIIGRMEN